MFDDLSRTLIIGSCRHASLRTRSVVTSGHRGKPLTVSVCDSILETLFTLGGTLAVTLWEVGVLGTPLITVPIIVGLLTHDGTLEAALTLSSELLTLGWTLLVLGCGQTGLGARWRLVTTIQIVILLTVIPDNIKCQQ